MEDSSLSSSSKCHASQTLPNDQHALSRTIISSSLSFTLSLEHPHRSVTPPAPPVLQQLVEDQVIPFVYSFVKDHINSENWRQREAALKSIFSILCVQPGAEQEQLPVGQLLKPCITISACWYQMFWKELTGGGSSAQRLVL
ncbi:Importin subunit beta-1 [Balamuthia mandrillaris]